MTNTSYLLRLGDGSSWHIIATPGTRLWVEKFARIMKLKADAQVQHNHWPRIFFLLKDSEKDGLKENLPGWGWRTQDLRSLQFWFHPACSDIICEIGNEGNYELDIIRMWTSIYIIYLRVQEKGGLLFHSALIQQDGKGVLLAGPGGAGKSTLCRRLPAPWCALSDDQTLVVRDAQKRYLAHPLPTWSDYLCRRSAGRWNVERYIRLVAIFFIKQANSDKVVPIGQGRAAVFINHSSQEVHNPIWRNLDAEKKKAVKKKIFDNACELAKTIPTYILSTSLNGRFWKEMEKVLENDC